MGDLVLVEYMGAVARLVLNRPERHNSLVPAMLEDLLLRLDEIQANEQLQALILAANGGSFSTGGDVRGFYDHLDSIVDYSDQLLSLLNASILSLMTLPMPIVAAVHGIVTGGSLGLVLATDVILATPRASFTPYYSEVGFSPDGGWTALLPHVIGAKRVSDILMTNRTITAEQAFAWGLVSRIVPPEEIQTEAERVAKVITSMKSGSLRSTKTLLNGQLGELRSLLDAERMSFVKQVQSAEARLGMETFLSQ